MPTVAPTLSAIPYFSAEAGRPHVRLNWVNNAEITSATLQFGIAFRFNNTSVFSFQEDITLTAGINKANEALNSLTTPVLRTFPGGLWISSVGYPLVVATTYQLRDVVYADGTTVARGPVLRLPNIAAVERADPGPPLAVLTPPSPLSAAHQIKETDLERSYAALIPSRLACDHDSMLERFARLIAASDFNQVETLQKLAEELYTMTTELAVGELEAESFDLEQGCYQPSSNLDARRRALLARKQSKGGNTVDWLQTIFTALGYLIPAITQTHQTRLGAVRVGDRLQRNAVWLNWHSNISEDATAARSVLECLVSEGRQAGIPYFIATAANAATYKQVA